MKRAYVFEDVSVWLLPVFMWAVYRGHPVYVFELSGRMRRFKAVRAAIRDGRVTLIYVYAAPGVGRYAIARADELVERMKDGGVVKLTCDLYGDPEAVRIYKKAVVELLFNTRFMVYYLDRLLHEGAASSIRFFPCQLTSICRLLRRYHLMDAQMTLNAKVTLPLVSLDPIASRFRSILVFSRRAVVFVLIALVQVIMRSFKSPLKPAAQALMGWSINSPWLIKFTGGRRYDFVIDEDKIKSTDIAYFVESPLPDEFIADETRRGRRFFSLSRKAMLKDLLHRNILDNDAVPFLKTVLKGWPHVFAPPVFLAAYASALSQFVYWNTVLRRISIAKYVYTNNESPAQIATDILLKRKGVDVWRYPIAMGGPYLFYTQGGPYDDAYHEFAFINTANWLLYNDAIRDSYASHNQDVGRFEIIGNYFADLINQSVNSGAYKKVFAELFPREVLGARPIVAVFDTTYIDSKDCQTSMEDGIGFFEDFASVAEKMSDTLFLFKPSKPDMNFLQEDIRFSSPRTGQRLLTARHRFGELENVFLADDQTDPTEIIAMSEVVVTHYCSSPTADALAAGKKAFWYEPRMKNVDTVIDRIGEVFVHGRASLEAALVHFVVPGSMHDRASIDACLFSSCVDPYLDGKALDRMRSALSHSPSFHSRENTHPQMPGPNI